MIKVENIEKKLIKEIGRAIGEAFMGQEGVLIKGFDYEAGVEYFSVITEICYNSGCLYTTSKNHEGFVAYWTKKTKPSFKYQLQMLFKLLTRVKFKSLLCLVKNLKGWEGYEKSLEKENDYVVIFMLVVLKEFQSKGYMKTLLSNPFQLAEKNEIPCVLDTDALIKAKKYEKCGMKIEKRLSDDEITMFYLRYN